MVEWGKSEIQYFIPHDMTDLSLEIHISYSLFLILRNECIDTQDDSLLGHQYLQYWRDYYDGLN